MMTKEQLFEKYSINESHNTWDNSIDNWYSVEVYRLMHNGELPKEDDLSILYVLDFLDKRKDLKWWSKNVMSKPMWGSYFLTAKRMVATLHEEILNQLNS